MTPKSQVSFFFGVNSTPALFDHRVAIHHHGLLHSHNPPPVRAILGQVDAAVAAGAQGSCLAEVVAVEDVFVHLR